MKFVWLAAFALLSASAFATQPVVSQIDAGAYESVYYRGWYNDGQKELVVAQYFTTQDQSVDPDACEVYYKPSLDSEFYLQGWAIRQSPELCYEIANNIAQNLQGGLAGSFHSDSSSVIDENEIDWGTGEFSPLP